MSGRTPAVGAGIRRSGIMTTPSKARVQNPYQNQKTPVKNNEASQPDAFASTPPRLPRASSTPRTTPVNPYAPYAKTTSYTSRATTVDKDARESVKRDIATLDFSREGDGGDRSSKKMSPARPLNKSASAEVAHLNLTEEIRNQPTELPSIDKSKIYTLYFDGGSRGNPGIAGAGMVIYDHKGKEIWSGKKYVGDYDTNNVAEYSGLISGLECARHLGIERIRVRGDSDLVVKQVSGQWQCKKSHLQVLLQKVLDQIEKLKEFNINHVARDHNSRADELANAAMDSRTTDLGTIDASIKAPEPSQESNGEAFLKLTGTFDDELLDEELRSLKVPFAHNSTAQNRVFGLQSAADDIDFDNDDSAIIECNVASRNAEDLTEDDESFSERSNDCSDQHEGGWLASLPFLARFEIERFRLQNNQSLKDAMRSNINLCDIISTIYSTSDPENTASSVPLYQPFLNHCLSNGFQVDEGKSSLFVFSAELSKEVKLLPPRKADAKTARLYRYFGSHRFLNLHLTEGCNLKTLKYYMKQNFTSDGKLIIAGRQYAIFYANSSESPVIFKLFAESGRGINKSDEMSVSEFVSSCIPPSLNPNLSVTKYMKRMKLSFTSTVPSLVLKPGELEAIPDIHGVNGCMTDGCGLISRDALNEVWAQYTRNDEERRMILNPEIKRPETNILCPYSSFQGRIGGLKGMFVLDGSLEGFKIQYRQSQVSLRHL